MEFPGGSDNYLAITGASHPFLSGAETFHTPSLGDEEFEIPPIPLESDPSLAVVGHFEDLPEPGGAPEPPFAPAPYGVGGLELPVAVGLPPGIMEQPGGLLNMELEPPMGSQFGPAAPVTIEVPLGALSPGALLGGAGSLATPLATPLTTIDQSELSTQLGLGLGGAAATPPGPAPGPAPAPPSPERGLSPAPSPAGSLQEEEPEEFRRPAAAAPSPPAPPAAPAAPASEPPRRAKPPKKAKKKKDPNEPQKPVSAYALFFRDTQAAIKGQNPNATFGEVSKIVASMWDSLGEEQKQVYKRKTEAAKKEYLKALTAYKATLTSTETPEPDPSPTPPPATPPTPSAPPPSSTTSSPPPPAAPSPPQAAPPPPPTITKIIIPKQILPPNLGGAPSGGVASSGGAQGVVTVIPLATPRPSLGGPAPPPPLPRLQPPPLQQMPPPPPQHGAGGGAAPSPSPTPQVTVLHPPPPPPPLQAMQAPPKIRAPPPLHIKILPPLHILPLPPPPATPTAQAGHAPGHAQGAGQQQEEAEVGGDVVVPEVESPPEVELVAESPAAEWPRGRCVRAGCDNPPVASADWDEEFCSSECLVRHCRDVFLAWLAARNAGSSVVFVK